MKNQPPVSEFGLQIFEGLHNHTERAMERINLPAVPSKLSPAIYPKQKDWVSLYQSRTWQSCRTCTNLRLTYFLPYTKFSFYSLHTELYFSARAGVASILFIRFLKRIL
uniref:Uncharacterized protein n=1 Tax=Arundo donax TaxID=35708 RepID=A0A0A9DSR6_ARUDO